MKKAIFLDRDGTLNKLFDKPYISDPSQVELVDDFVKDVLHWLKKDFLLILVTNQT